MIRTRRQKEALEAIWAEADQEITPPPLAASSSSSGSSSSLGAGSDTTTEAGGRGSSSSRRSRRRSVQQDVDAEEEEDEDPDADKSRAVGILFLAHDGITNPELWERWRLSDPAYAERIRFFVFRNQKVVHESAFAIWHDLRLRLRTQWCSASIVKATVESLKRVLLLDPEVAMVYLVSGFDIPIQPPSALFTTRHVVTEGVPRTVVPFRTVLGYTHEDEALRAAEGWAKKGSDEDVRSKVACHVQWCGLSRAHAERVVAFKGLERLLALGNRLSCESCPDEWLLGTILALQGVTRDSPDVLDWVITDQYRKKGKDQSPILWGDLDRTKARVFWAPPSCFRTFTLGAVLNAVSRREGNLFFRKVGPLTEAETERVLAPILLPASAHANTKASPTSLPVSLSGESHDTDMPHWEPASDGEPPSSSASSAASPARRPLSPAPSASSSYCEPDVDDDEEEEEEEELANLQELASVEASFSSSAASAASSVATASRSPSPLLPLLPLSYMSSSSSSEAEPASAVVAVGPARRGKEDEREDAGDADSSLVPSTPHLQRLRARPPSRAETHKRVAAEAALSDVEEREGAEAGEGGGGGGGDEDGTEHVIPARRNLRMVGPPGRCANGQC